jgi:hypothetical protein
VCKDLLSPRWGYLFSRSLTPGSLRDCLKTGVSKGGRENSRGQAAQRRGPRLRRHQGMSPGRGGGKSSFPCAFCRPCRGSRSNSGSTPGCASLARGYCLPPFQGGACRQIICLPPSQGGACRQIICLPPSQGGACRQIFCLPPSQGGDWQPIICPPCFEAGSSLARGYCPNAAPRRTLQYFHTFEAQPGIEREPDREPRPATGCTWKWRIPSPGITRL